MIESILIDAFAQRVSSWKIMKEMLTMCDLPIGKGRDATISRLLRQQFPASEIKFQELRTLYSNHILVGQKVIRFFNVKEEYIDKLICLFEFYEIEPTVYQKHYPFPVPDEDLTGIDALPKLSHIETTDENISLVFCTRRSFTERTEIDIGDFNTEIQEKLVYYDKIYGTKRCIYQFFDIIVIWRNRNLVEIRIDITKNSLSQEYDNSFSRITKSFNSLVDTSLGIQEILRNRVNFFPLIDKLYYSQNEGKVFELFFTTDEGSTKKEIIKKDKGDLRYETYHNAGKNAVHHITAYHLAILWNFIISKHIQSQTIDIETQVELILPGKYYILSSTNPTIEQIIIEECGFIEQYKFIFNIIDKYLKS